MTFRLRQSNLLPFPARIRMSPFATIAIALGVLLLTFVGGAAGAAEPLDVVFVLDNSGSMKSNDPQFLTRRAVSDFIEAMAADSEIEGRVAIVLFDERARLAQPLTPAGNLASTKRLEASLGALDFSGQRTNSPAGVERALYELRERGREGARKAIVFLTDGKIDTGDRRGDTEVARWLREELAEESAQNDVRIFGIAFTETADYQLMQALAQRTSARYYRALAASELSPVVEDVLAKIVAPPIYDLAFGDITTPAPAATPSVSAAPIQNAAGRSADEETDSNGTGLLGLIPVALLLVGAALFLRRRNENGAFAWSGLGRSQPAPRAQLLDVGGQLGDAGRTLALGTLRTTVGRDPHNDIVLEDDTISSEHALIEVKDGRYWLRDLRSTNGTRVADRRLEPDESVPLKGGDHVRFADVDLMFVVEGYVPGGATVYLSSSTTPPANWSRLAGSTDASRLFPADQSEPEAPAAKDLAGEEHASSSSSPSPDTSERAENEAAFAAERHRLDPASVVDLDEALEPGDAPPSDEGRPADSSLQAADREAIERAEAALAEIDAASEAEKAAESEPARTGAEEPPSLSLLRSEETDPDEAEDASEDAAESSTALAPDEIEPERDRTEPPASPAVDLDSTTEIPIAAARDAVAVQRDTQEPSPDALRRCLDYHLDRVAEISPPFETFVTNAFGEELREALPVAARDLIVAARDSSRIEEREYTAKRVRYVLYGVPGSMEDARSRFAEGHGGFTRLLAERLQADSFRTDRCEILTILTFGQGEGGEPWVSLSIVPDEGQDPRIDLLSYEFLTPEERREIEPTVDPEISQSGLA